MNKHVGNWVVAFSFLLPAAAMADAPELQNRGPVLCGKAETVKLENVRIDGAGPAIAASGACEVVIKNSEIRGKRIALLVSGAAKVRLENTTVTGARAVEASGSSHVTANRSTVYGSTVATSASGTSRIELKQSKVFGRKHVARTAAIRSDKKTVWARYRKPRQ